MPMLAPPDRPLTDGIVTLRAWRSEDLDAVVAAVQDPEIPRWTRVPSPYGAAEFDAWMTDQADQQVAGTELHFLIVDQDGRRRAHGLEPPGGKRGDPAQLLTDLGAGRGDLRDREVLRIGSVALTRARRYCAIALAHTVPEDIHARYEAMGFVPVH